MADEEGIHTPADEAEGSATGPAGDAEPITEPVPPVADASAPPPPPPAAAASGWSRPSGVPVLTLALGALLIGMLAFAFGVFAGRSSAGASGRDGLSGMLGGGDRGAVAPGRPGTMMPGMPGAIVPGMPGGAMPGGAMPGGAMPGGGTEPAMPGAVAPGNWVITAGTVTRVDGDTIVVESVRGNTVTVHTSDATSIRIVHDGGQASDAIAEGDDIVAAGTPSDGELTIDAVRVVAGDLPWIRSIEGAGSATGTTGATTAS
jgi:hypothetical protein